jgi:DmsE family decaheme c-type cytochrome
MLWKNSKGEVMKSRFGTILFFSSVLLAVIVSLAFPQDRFRLQKGAKGKLCLKCHAKFEEKLKSPSIHTPVKEGECTSCHNPHASSHGKLLAEEPRKVCFECHGGIVAGNARSSHKIVAEGNCVKCHDPHAAKHKYNLLLAGDELCFSCHKEIEDAVKTVKFKHSPVQRGCINCHNPHASTRAVALLKNDVSALCASCHKTNTLSFAKQHMNYPVAQALCTSCHNPHGSNRQGLLFDTVHQPVANKMCSQCHRDPSSPDAVKTKKVGYDLCKGCHSDVVNESLGKSRVHWPILDKAACLNCHNPHAATEKGLLKAKMITLCGECHQDTIERQEKSLTKHPPIAIGECTSCHSPHASDNLFLNAKGSVIDLCGNCHEWTKHSSHPIGEKVKDPRNPNLTLDCLSCHRSHGSEFKGFTHYNPKMDLCIECHETFKR